MAEIGAIQPLALKARLDHGDDLLILDVREPNEVLVAPFRGATHIPMREIPSRLAELDRDREIVVVCHHGVRSALVAMHLARLGFEHVLNLTGGIDAWSETADPTTPRY